LALKLEINQCMSCSYKIGVLLFCSFHPDFRNLSGLWSFKPHHHDKVAHYGGSFQVQCYATIYVVIVSLHLVEIYICRYVFLCIINFLFFFFCEAFDVFSKYTAFCLWYLIFLTFIISAVHFIVTRWLFTCESRYCFQRILAIAILSVCLSVHPSVRHTGGSVKNGAI